LRRDDGSIACSIGWPRQPEAAPQRPEKSASLNSIPQVEARRTDPLRISPPDFNPSSNENLLLAYVADLELEVDRLRKRGQFLHHETVEMLRRVEAALQPDAPPEAATSTIVELTAEFRAVLRDLYDPPSYHPAHDQVIAIAVRPVIEQVFRWQQRLSGACHANLHMELATESINWFPARFRHIVDNLISNALRYRDPAKGETRVVVTVNRLPDGIELRVTDNGIGMPWDERTEAFQLFYHTTPVGSAGLGVGLAVVKLLIEQCGGALTVESVPGKGTNFITVLPRYDVGDFVN
jgi:signal transduction histidine kinase